MQLCVAFSLAPSIPLGHTVNHSLLEAYLDCFHILVIVNKAIKTFANRFLFGHKVLFTLGKFQGVEQLGHMARCACCC